MELEISPTPSEAEREAIVAALEDLGARLKSGRGAWWEAGVRETLDAELRDRSVAEESRGEPRIVQP